ncbi:MAG: hypothetical protein LZF62_380023 [Nitrospira sp.]|nr:MAG: hypothetical protein LZF62_380023 [Nitrospira sp.]
MVLELAIIIVIAVIAIWFFLGDNSKGKVVKKPETWPIEQPSIDVMPRSDSDAFLSEIVHAKQQTTLQIERASREDENQFETLFSSDIELRRRLSQFAREQELDKALLALWKEIEHYPDWAQREDSKTWNLLEIADIVSSQAGETRTISFSFDSHLYALSRNTCLGTFDNNQYENFVLQEDGSEVFGISCSPEWDGYGTNYKCLSVTKFKKRGQWAKLLLEMFGRIQLDRKRSSIKAKYSSAAEIKKHFEE